MPTPFISRDDLGDYVGRDLSDDDGALIAVDSACQIVRTLTEQDFTAATETVNLDGTGTDIVFLPQRPVTDVSSVTVNGEDDTDFLFTSEGRLIRTSGTAYSTWGRTSQPCAYWPQGRQNITVTYDHGAGTVPSDVRMVALSIANRMVTQGGAVSEQVGQVRKTYAASSTDLTNGEKAILRRHRTS